MPTERRSQRSLFAVATVVALLLVGALWIGMERTVHLTRDDGGAGVVDPTAEDLTPLRSESAKAYEPRSAEDGAGASGTLVVSVVDAQDRPLAEQTVVALLFKPGAMMSSEELRGRTGPDGSCLFPDVPPYAVTVRDALGISASGRVVRGGTTRLTLRRESPLTLRGLVINDQGVPVPGAHVLTGKASTVTGAEPLELAVTDASGEFSLSGLQSGWHYWIWVWARGHSPTLPRLVAERSLETPTEWREEFVLPVGGASARGRVVAQGSPLENALVVIGPIGPVHRTVSVEGVPMGAPGAPPRRVRTDAEGSFECHGLAPGRTSVTVVAAGLSPSVTRATLDVGPNDLGLLSLEGVGSIHGRVTDEEGTPLAGVTIECGRRGNAGYLKTESGRDGCYELVGVPFDEMHLLASWKGHRIPEALRLDSDEVEREWSPTFPRVRTIQIHVEPNDCLPREGLSLAASSRGWRRSARLEGSEAFLDGVPLGELEVSLMARGSGFPLARVHCGADQERLSLSIGEERCPGTVRGRLAPDPGLGWAGLPVATLLSDSDASEVIQYAHVRQDLSFEVLDVPPGDYELWASFRRGVPGLRLLDFTVPPGTDVDLGQIAEPATQDLRLVGAEGCASEFWLRDAQGESLRRGQLGPGEETSIPLAAGRYEIAVKGDCVSWTAEDLWLQGGKDQKVFDFRQLEAAGHRFRGEIRIVGPADMAPPYTVSVSRDSKILFQKTCVLRDWVVPVCLDAGLYEVALQGSSDDRRVSRLQVTGEEEKGSVSLVNDWVQVAQ